MTDTQKLLNDIRELKAYHQNALAKCQKIEEKLAGVSTPANKKKTELNEFYAQKAKEQRIKRQARYN